jgi:hypothetical protein
MKKLIIALSITICAIIILCAVFLCTSGLGTVILEQRILAKKADVSNVEIILAETNEYTADELKSAAQALKKHFSKQKNLTLDKIWYTDEECLPIIEEEKQKHEEDIIVLYAKFTMDEKEWHIDQGFEPNGIYEWFYLLTKNQDGTWSKTNTYGVW